MKFHVASGCIACALMMSLVLPCAAQSTPPDIARITKNKILVVAMYGIDTPPFFVADNTGNLSGLDVELSKKIAQELGVNVRFVRTAKTFDEVVDMIVTRNADIAVSNLSCTIRRAQRVLFSKPYIVLYHSFCINRLIAPKSEGIGWINAPGIRIGVLKSSAWVDYARRDYPHAQLVLYDKWEDAAAKAAAGAVHATFGDHVQSIRWRAVHPEVMLNVKTKIIRNKVDPIAIAVHWEDQHLLAWINVVLEHMEQDGTLHALRSRYIQPDKDME